MAHYCQSIVLLIESYCFESFFNLYFRETKITVEIPANYLHESKSWLFVFALCIPVCVSLTKSVLLEFNAFLYRSFNLEKVDG